MMTSESRKAEAIGKQICEGLKAEAGIVSPSKNHRQQLNGNQEFYSNLKKSIVCSSCLCSRCGRCGEECPACKLANCARLKATTSCSGFYFKGR